MCRRGWRVGVIKHSSHRLELDRKGTDSWRLARAGAVTTVISSPGTLAAFQTLPEGELPPGEIAARHMPGLDIVLAEGFKGCDLPKIEVYRATAGPVPLCLAEGGDARDPEFIAVVSDDPLPGAPPRFALDDPVPLCNFLEERFLRTPA